MSNTKPCIDNQHILFQKDDDLSSKAITCNFPEFPQRKLRAIRNRNVPKQNSRNLRKQKKSLLVQSTMLIDGSVLDTSQLSQTLSPSHKTKNITDLPENNTINPKQNSTYLDTTGERFAAGPISQ